MLGPGGFSVAVTEGFEPSVQGHYTQHFECCTFGRSDTSPRKSLRDLGPMRESTLASPNVRPPV